VAPALIPFLEHDDANRALMGSNMQRQAVPLLVTERAVRGTGMEERVARDSRAVVVAEEPARWPRVTATRSSSPRTAKLPSKKTPRATSNGICLPAQVHALQRRHLHQPEADRPSKGQKIKKGEVLADGPCTDQGELALGRNVLVAFMPWNGYNFEDAILISERLVKEDVYTSIHIEEFECGARDTKLGPEEITRDIPNVGEEALKNLDHDGVIRIGAEVKPGDILVGKITPKSRPNWLRKSASCAPSSARRPRT
jgi:DNA-directed RNA polymerase subunit beta